MIANAVEGDPKNNFSSQCYRLPLGYLKCSENVHVCFYLDCQKLDVLCKAMHPYYLMVIDLFLIYGLV